ncbi:hypothetical protein ACGF5H_07490 [Micromonospora chalcea]
MEIARLVLDYLKALLVPITVVVLASIFRGEIKAWLIRSKFPANGSAEIPGLGKYTWGAAADRISDSATEALNAAAEGANPGQGAGLPEQRADKSDDPGDKPSLSELFPDIALRLSVGYRNWKELRALAVENPVAGVLDAWRTVSYKVYEHAYSEKFEGFSSKYWDDNVSLAARRLGASLQVAAVLADLKELRDRAADGEPISRNDALEYIQAAETVLQAWEGSPFGSAEGRNR